MRSVADVYLTAAEIPELLAAEDYVWMAQIIYLLLAYGYLVNGAPSDTRADIFNHIPQYGQFAVGCKLGDDVWQHYIDRTLVRQGTTVDDLKHYLRETLGDPV